MAGRSRASGLVPLILFAAVLLAVLKFGCLRGLAVGVPCALWVWAFYRLATSGGGAAGRGGWLILLILLGPAAALIYTILRPYDQWSYSRRQRRLVQSLTYVLLIVLGTAFTLPFFWLLSTSFKPAERIQRWPPDILPMQVVTEDSYNGKPQVYEFIGAGQPPRGLKRIAVLETLQGGKARVTSSHYGQLCRTVAPFIVNLDDYTPVVRPGLEWRNYTRGLVFVPFLQQLRNTLIICIACVIGTLFSCSLVAYGLSKIEWRGRQVLFMVILSTMMLPFQVTMVPLFAVFARVGWVDTYLPLTVPAFLGNAFFIFLLRQFFMTIPKDLSEAATLDGCSEFDIYRRVILPLSKPALAMVGLWTFMGAWNDFVGPLIYIVDQSKYTLSLGLAMFLGQYGNEYGMLMAVSTVVTVPIIILFFFTQRTFIQGITLTGIKG